MLLGPGEFIQIRKKVQRELVRLGYNVIIMEDIREEITDVGLDEKFERIMKGFAPLFIAFFHKEAKNMEGVIFEIGCICCKYGCRKIGKRLRLLADKKYDWDKRTPYINTLFSRVVKDEFDESKSHHKASKRIHNFVVDFLGIKD